DLHGGRAETFEELHGPRLSIHPALALIFDVRCQESQDPLLAIDATTNLARVSWDIGEIVVAKRAYDIRVGMRTGREFPQKCEEKRVIERKRRIRLLSSEQACFRRPDFCREVIFDSKLSHARSMPAIACGQNLPDLLAARANIQRIPENHAVRKSGNHR